MSAYRMISLPSDEPVQYVGTYVTRYPRGVGEPTVAFVEDDALSAVLAVARELVAYRDGVSATQVQLEKLDDFINRLRAALEAK